MSLKDNNACLLTLLKDRDSSIFDSNSSERNTSSTFSIRVWNPFEYTFSSSSMLSVLESQLTLYTHSCSPFCAIFCSSTSSSISETKALSRCKSSLSSLPNQHDRGGYILCCLLTWTWGWLCVHGFGDLDFFPSLVL